MALDNRIENTGTILKNLTVADGGGIVEILNTRDLFAPYDDLSTAWHIGKKLQIEKFQATINLTGSLAAAPIPDIAPEDTAAERQIKIALSQGQYPSMGLAIYRMVGNAGWVREARPQVQNYGNENYFPLLQPYVTISEVELAGDNERLGVQLKDVGSGLIASENDYVTIKASWSQTLSLVRRETGIISATIPFGKDLPGGEVSQIVPTRKGRRFFSIQNFGNARVWILPTNTMSDLAIGTGLFLNPDGSATLPFEEWALELPVLGLAEAPTRVVGFEGVTP